MIEKIVDNIISPLGSDTESNYKAVKSGRSCLRRYDHYKDLPEPFMASLFSDEQWHEIYRLAGLEEAQHLYTRFESLVIASITSALQQIYIDVTSPRVLFILSTTKGNVELLGQRSPSFPKERILLGNAAEIITRHFRNPNIPIVASNACISGLCAQITAKRVLESGRYDKVVVCGADVQSRFTISGFQSLKALSIEECKPFDISRNGLNLGEAAATIIYGMTPNVTKEGGNRWNAVAGSIHNDAYHISTPSKDAEGCYRALRDVVSPGREEIAMISTHGTSTLYNDEMESKALARAGADHIPINSFKGYYGHTMGAAGVLETILSMRSLEDHAVLATRGFNRLGVSHPVNISSENRPTILHSFIKMLSGFGGCNATMRYVMNVDQTANRDGERLSSDKPLKPLYGKISHDVKISPSEIALDGNDLPIEGYGHELLINAYKQMKCCYPKFFKMDGLCRLGFIASELLLQQEGERCFNEKGMITEEHACDDRAVILFNRYGSLCDDHEYQQTIESSNRFYPSPAIFVYTLPNIVTGEIAIRNRYYGETSFYVLPQHDDKVITRMVEDVLSEEKTNSVLYGWVDYEDHEHFEANLKIIKK